MVGLQYKNLVATIHSTAASVASLHRDHIEIVEDAVKQLGQDLSSRVDEVKAVASRGLTFPIKFDDVKSEITFLTLYHLLDFGSGWDSELRRSGGRGARDTILFGLIGLHLSGTRIDHHWMKACSMFNITSLFGINSHVEAPLDNLPGVTMSRPGPLQPLCVALQQAVVSAGEALEEAGQRSLGDAVLAVVEETQAGGRPPSAVSLVQELVDMLPGFQDVVLYDGVQLPLARKAQALALTLAHALGERDKRFAFTDLADLTADSGPYLTAALRARGVLRLSGDLATTLDSHQDLPAGPHERALRAATVAAADGVAAAAGGALSAWEVGAYLECLTEEGQELHDSLASMYRTKCTAY
eukprot:CAMPEP_0202915646 /NCGR_PEP_ID=MMETSP1392-20130828/66246_1 /ASSEMBLY_ACC=CAM_ASM_000868 /TAXON_ID=225041 /ORGANISM="Chlamydomonas chlamydogama, Strain SAG 11-48b" /LENGTH=355 /DNA_ID=CAMNT_0049607765 /DNA_START=15 /DNA_END=1082 /DNA_ORIENTATION=+